MAAFQIHDASRLSHAYILSSVNREESLARAREIAAAALCSAASDVPCGRCRSCRKVREGIHPDLITVGRQPDSKGKLRREILVDQIREVSMDACVLPNEAARKVYVIEDAECMNLNAQNAALKLLEEPPKGVVFLLCTANAGLLLPTVRSRCVELRCGAEAAEESEESRELAAEFVEIVARGDRAALASWCFRNESMDLSSLSAFLGSVSTLLADMVCGRKPGRGLRVQEILRLQRLVEQAGSYLRVNVGPKHIMGLLMADAVSVDGK